MHPNDVPGTDSPNASLSIPLGDLPAPRRPARRGAPCPRCGEGLMDYNGVLDLECPKCGYTEGGGGGCT
jgi:hypothetical protein